MYLTTTVTVQCRAMPRGQSCWRLGLCDVQCVCDVPYYYRILPYNARRPVLLGLCYDSCAEEKAAAAAVATSSGQRGRPSPFGPIVALARDVHSPGIPGTLVTNWGNKRSSATGLPFGCISRGGIPSVAFQPGVTQCEYAAKECPYGDIK